MPWVAETTGFRKTGYVADTIRISQSGEVAFYRIRFSADGYNSLYGSERKASALRNATPEEIAAAIGCTIADLTEDDLRQVL